VPPSKNEHAYVVATHLNRFHRRRYADRADVQGPQKLLLGGDNLSALIQVIRRWEFQESLGSYYTRTPKQREEHEQMLTAEAGGSVASSDASENRTATSAKPSQKKVSPVQIPSFPPCEDLEIEQCPLWAEAGQCQ